jgi:multiple sugar transport system substrate-binding protein
VESEAVALVDKDIKVTKKLKWLSWYPLDETQPAFELFKQVYGVPEPEKGGNITEWINVSYDDRAKELAKMVAAGTPPDLYPFEDRIFPYGIHQNLFEPVDDLFDESKPIFDTYRVETDLIKWKGRMYTPVTYVTPSSMLWYRRSVAEEAGITDPYELYKQGKWNWDTFLEVCRKFSDPDEKMYAIDGWPVDSALPLTTGKPMIGIQNGALVSHLNDPAIERAADLLETLAKNNYRDPREDYNVHSDAWANGKTLFYADGYNVFQTTFKQYRQTHNWSADEIMFVPYPKDPRADKYYQGAQLTGFLSPRGSQNREGYKALIECTLASTNKEPTSGAFLEKQKKDYGWTDEMYALLDELRLNFAHVYEFKNGIGDDVASATNAQSPVELMTKGVYMDAAGADGTEYVNYAQARAAFENIINSRITELNSSIH